MGKENHILITSQKDLQAYLQESLAYSCLIPEVKARWGHHALMEWYVPLLRAGYTGIPFFIVLDLGGRVVQQGHAFSFSLDTAPDTGLYHRYTLALDAFCRDTGIRDVMADITLHRQDPGIVIFLKRMLIPVLAHAPIVVSIDDDILNFSHSLQVSYGTPATSGRQFHDLMETFIETFARLTLDSRAHRPDITNTPLSAMSDRDRRLVLGVAMQEHALSYPDVELIDRCMRMDDLPPLTTHTQESVIRTMQTIRLEQPVTRSASYEGGYIGIRNDGSIEDLTTPVMSEWAYPAPVLWEKLTNRRLLIYERASRSVHVNKMLLHIILLNHSRLLQVDSTNGSLPLREMKWLMASIIRDLTAYLCHMRTVEVHLNMQMVSNPDVGLNVRSISLNGITPDRIRQPNHFLLDARDMFPWFFSSDLVETPAFAPFPAGDDRRDTDIELVEECLPERDIMLGKHNIGFENVHCFLFCTEEQYRSERPGIIDHIRAHMDLGPNSLDSLVFIVLTASPSKSPIWRVEPVHQYHRELDREHTESHDTDDRHAGENMTHLEVREMIRQYFLARLLGIRFRKV